MNISFTAALQPTDLPLQPILFSTGGRGKKAVLRLRKANSPWSEKITVAKQTCERVTIPAAAPFTRMDSHYSISMKSMMAPFIHTRLLVVSPRYLLINKTHRSLMLCHQNERIILPATSCQPQVDFLPSPQRLLTICAGETGLQSAAFDCDSQQQADLMLPGEKTELLSVTTRPLGDLQAIVVDHLVCKVIVMIINDDDLEGGRLINRSLKILDIVLATTQPLISSRSFRVPAIVLPL